MAVEFAFGLHAVEEMLRQNPQGIRALTVVKGRDDKRMAAVLSLAQQHGLAVRKVERDVLDELVDGRHQGVVAELQSAGAAAEDLRWSEADLVTAVRNNSDSLVLVLDGVTDPHNLGACLRSADAAGVTAVLTPKDGAADITAVVRKVACGATESVPLVRATNLARALDQLKDAGMWLYGTAGEAEQTLYDCDFKGPVGIIMGAEGPGMRRLTRERCDFLVNLPMAGVVSSLNVSVATGICLFEVQRQRLRK